MLKSVQLTGKELTKTALVSFLTEPVRRAQNGEKLYPFSNLGLAVELVRVLNKEGYAVDVVEWNDTKLPRNKTYDLFIGHASINFSQLMSTNTFGKTIYFATGSSAIFHNAEAQKRSDEFWQRHKVRIKPDRMVDPKEAKIYGLADVVICLGNSRIASTFDVEHIEHLNIAASPMRPLLLPRVGKSAKHILFFSGGGNLHKGLDLAIESVIDTDLTLHVCTIIDEKFLNVYRKLYSPEQLKNVKFHGFVAHGSRLFRQLIRRCQFVLLLSCSEGSPGSLIDIMQYGLIPVVTPACGLDVAKVGFVVEGIKIKDISKLLLRASRTPKVELKQLSDQTKQLVKDDFSRADFDTKLSSAIRRLTQ